MQTVSKYPHGLFCWVDLVTADAQAAKNFYTPLFDWETEDAPAGENMVYVMCRRHGEDVCAMYTMSPDMREQNIPPHWASYISVDDVDAAVALAGELGASVACPPLDVMDVGRMATIQDPGGAWVNLWQPKRHIGATLVNQPQTWCWNELSTHDTAAAAAFYGEMFGWQASVSAGLAGPYTSFSLDGRMFAGMLQIQPDWGDLPPSWGVYFAVADCAAVVTKVQQLGGSVIMPETALPEIGRFAVVRDAQGAVFTVIALERTDPPPGH